MNFSVVCFWARAIDGATAGSTSPAMPAASKLRLFIT